jgi:hypothetical protein
MSYQRASIFKALPLVMMTSFLGAAGCGQWLSPDQGDASSTLATAPQARAKGTIITFTKWNDYLRIDAATERAGDACKFLAPRVDDASTRWKPLQLYWVIVDSPNDVTYGTEIRETFFDGDLLTAAQVQAHGFATVKDQHASMLPLSGLGTSEDGTVVSGTIGSPFNAALRLTTTVDGEGCASQATYCRTNTDCSQAANYRPLKAIHVTQNFFGAVSNVTFE